MITPSSVADADLQIRGGGGRGLRGLTIRGSPGLPGPSPRSATAPRSAYFNSSYHIQPYPIIANYPATL